MMGERPDFRKAALAAMIGAAVFGAGQEAVAREPLLRRGPPVVAGPPVARYVSDDGHSFVLDRSQARPLLRFEDNPEVWVLHPHPAPRGDVIFKNELGEPVLRATRLGGVTLFTPHRPGGEAVSLAGEGASLRLLPIGPHALLDRLALASARISRAARRLVLVQAEATPASSALMADAAMVTSVALTRMAERKEGRKLLAHIRRVSLIEGKKPSAKMNAGGELLITVAPQQGVAGRPSSHRIVMAAGHQPATRAAIP
jgi:hypothetical protein